MNLKNLYAVNEIMAPRIIPVVKILSKFNWKRRMLQFQISCKSILSIISNAMHIYFVTEGK